MNFQNYPHISKHFGGSRLEKDHPLRILNSNIEYIDYVETILRELDRTPNLHIKKTALTNYTKRAVLSLYYVLK